MTLLTVTLCADTLNTMGPAQKKAAVEKKPMPTEVLSCLVLEPGLFGETVTWH